MHLLLIMWIGIAPAGIGAASYESFPTLDACEARLEQELNAQVVASAKREDRSLPLMRCIKVTYEG